MLLISHDQLTSEDLEPQSLEGPETGKSQAGIAAGSATSSSVPSRRAKHFAPSRPKS
jgi:hypothetical protein